MNDSLELHVVRHAQALAGMAGDDKGRDLSEEGHARAAQLGSELASIGFDKALASSALRARQTLDGIQSASTAGMGSVQIEDIFYSAGVDTWLDALRELGSSVRRVLLVGHNPVLSQLVSDLTGTHVSLKAGQRVRLVGTGDWAGLASGCMSRETIETG